MKFSIIIPVFNRPDELDELLGSLEKQSFRDFEVIVVEDGSSISSESAVEKHRAAMPINYIQKPNTGPGPSRNAGVQAAGGEYAIILDSDCVLPDSYLESVSRAIEKRNPDAFGGPDRASASFSHIQKAISFAMTSFFTTGGIRGGAEKLDHFYPRSFNMGVRREVYNALGGFSRMRFGEDLDFSYRLVEAGYKSILVKDAWVWHKRRTDFKKFYRQVFNSGIARINLSLRHPGTLKAVHALPAVFAAGVALLLAAAAAACCFGHFIPALLILSPIALYALLLFFASLLDSGNFKTASLSVPASFIQLCGYGLGFISAAFRRVILRKNEYSAFDNTFYK